MFNKNQLELIRNIDCSRCSDSRACDGVKYECPKVNFQTLLVDDVSILKTFVTKQVIKENDVQEPDFIKTTKNDFETHQYGNISRCRHQNKILSFFSGEKEVQGLYLFYFSHQGGYYRAFRDKNTTDAVLEKQVMNFLYPDNQSFMYAGWLCRFDREDMLFHLYTPSELEQPFDVRNSELEASSPAQAIEFINCY